ncbi:MAG: UvrD-helicase domain-containing protein [Ruminococcus sp.]|nr:UvrD-helicase domain-containing protein [Ruminococcus sp.]
MKWTEEQLQAINLEGSNIIVSAGAGSGKTAVLSERVLRKVKEGIDIRQILILTFTNEAAGEMKERIRKKLKKANLKDTLKYIDSAYITTFDAYALSMVKKYHYLFNISNNIKIIDSSIIDLKKEEILDNIFLELYKKKDKNFLKLVGDFTNRDDDTIKKAILSINKSLDLKYDKKEYLINYLDNFYNEEYLDNLFKEYFSYLKDLSSLIESELYSLENFLDDKNYLKIYDAYSIFLNPKNYSDLFKIKDLPKVQFRSLEEEGLIIKDNLKEHVKELIDLTRFSEEDLKEELISTKEYVSSIIEIILKLDDKLNIYKKEQVAFEFIDISKMAIELVKNHNDVKEELKNSYQEIMIDEYQDTNDLQELFISEIANNNTYMVGDIKQSIYRFRNANPKIFKNKYDNYAKNINGKKIDLVKNFRSRKEVLSNINLIFNLIMTEDIGGVNYKESHNMIYGNKTYEEEGNNSYNNNMEIIKYDNDLQEFTNTEIEIFTIVKDIKNKLNNNYQVFDFDLNKKRNATYKDFCIILDRGTDMPLYKKVFEYFNIPLDVYKDNDLVSSNDILIIKNIINLIIKIYNKSYDKKMQYYFVSIARSFLGNLKDQEIFTFINNNTFYNSDIYSTCYNLSLNLENKTPTILLNEIIEKFNIYHNLIKIGDVNTSIIRLDNLLSLASNAEELGYTINDFSKFLETIVDSNKEIRYKETKDTSDCVKIMNIHKSKGLEFPICYFTGFKKTFNLSDLKSRFMFDNKYGILTPYFKEGIGTLLTKTLIKNKYYLEEISEKIRLFYVALTRAKEKIIMIIPEFKQEKEIVNLSKIEGLNFRSFYDFMSTISLNIKDYTSTINIEDLNLTKDYEFFKRENINIEENNNLKITFKENHNNSILEENLHASKTTNKLITKEEARKLEYGTSLHNMLELTDFKKKSTNKYVKHLQDTFDFKSANVYQELEFLYDEEGISYHGIIDLMLEYKDEIKIIDYKLKNIDDEGYTKQLNIYYNYIKSVSDKNISLYLYSLIDNKIKEVEVLETIKN